MSKIFSNFALAFPIMGSEESDDFAFCPRL